MVDEAEGRMDGATAGRAPDAPSGSADELADHRIGDAERQQAIDMLRAHTTAGRLTLDEFSDLAGEVFAAQTYGELEAVGRKLPPGLVPIDGAAPGGAAQGAAAGVPGHRPLAGGPPSDTAGHPAPALAPAPVAGASPAVEGPRRRCVVAIMCGAHPRGRWRPAARLKAVAFWGGANVDLREAEFPGPVIDIYAWSIMGGLSVTVPEGTRVELDGPVIMGGAGDNTRRTGLEPRPDAPLVRVHARVFWGGLGIRNPSRKAQLKRALADEARRMADEARWSAVDQARRAAHEGRLGSGRATHRPDVLELPQGVLDDLDRILHDQPSDPEPAREPARTRSARGPRAPRPPRSPGPPWASSPPGVPQPPGSARPPGPPLPWPWPSPAHEPATVGSSSDAAPSGGDTPSGTLTMMITDIAESTRLAEKLGDRRWIEIVGEHNALVREQVARHGGTEVKALGDGFLVVFPSARRAILSAVDVQRALADYRDERPDTPVDVRIGLHTGEIVDVDGDVLGQNVVVAARIADHAAPGEIVVSGLTRDLTVSGGDLAFGPPDDVELKGLSQPWRVHRVSWAPTAPAAPGS